MPAKALLSGSGCTKMCVSGWEMHFLGRTWRTGCFPAHSSLLGLLLWELSAFFFFNTWTIPDPLFWVETNLCFGRELFPISFLSEEKITFAPCSGNCTSQNFTFPSPDSKVVPGRMSCGSERGCALLPHLLWGLPGLAVSLDAWWEQSKTAVMAWTGIPKINIKRKRGSCPNTACKPLILCDSDTLSQVISSINVAAVMEAADSVRRRRFDGRYNNLS